MNITNAEIAQASIESFGGIVCIMLAIIIIMNKPEKKSPKYFIGMFFTIASIFIFEAGAYVFRGNTSDFCFRMTEICNFVVFMLNPILANLCVRYVISIVKENDIIPSKIFRRLADAGVFVVLLILVVNQYTHWMYSFDENNYYHRGFMWYIYTLVCLVCILLSCVVGIKYREVIGKVKFISIIVYAAAPIITVVIQIFIYGISVTNIGLAIAVFIMLLGYLTDWSKEKNRARDERAKRRLELVVLFFIMFVSMSAAVVSCILSINRITLKNSESDSRIIAHMVADNIENKMMRPIMVANTMSNDYYLKNHLDKSDAVSEKIMESNMRDYLTSIRDGFGYQMVFCVGEKTKAYYTFGGIGKYIDPENDKHDIWYKEVIDSGKSYVLNVDTDEVNNWSLSVFVNSIVTDDKGEFLGVCGVGVDMEYLKSLIKDFEDEYSVKIALVDSEGLIQVASDGQRIEHDYLESSYFKKVKSDAFYFEKLEYSSRMTKYIEDFDWYLVVEDMNPEKINVKEITVPSIIIFLIGMGVLAVAFTTIYVRDRKNERELRERRKAAITDELTGAYNRRAYEEDCADLKNNSSYKKKVIIMVDVNGLKTANDTLGHNAGDELITGTADCMNNAFSGLGKVYRIGGDEFAAILDCSKDNALDAVKTLEHLTEKWKGSLVKELALAKGVIVCEEYPEADFNQLKEMADKLMYEDKSEYYIRTGKDRRRK